MSARPLAQVMAQLFQLGVDGLDFGFQRARLRRVEAGIVVAVFGVVEVFKPLVGFLLGGQQRIARGLLLRRRRALLHRRHPEALPLRVIERGPRLGPGPAFALEGLRPLGQPLDGQTLQQFGVGDVAAACILEQVAHHDTARCLVGRDADELGQGVGGRVDFAPEQQAAQTAGVAVVGRRRVPNPFLRGVVVGDRQRHQLVKVDLVLPEQLEQHRRHLRQLQAALHRQRRDAEAHRHVFHARPCGDHLGEGRDGIGHAHRSPATVLGHARGDGGIARDQPAKNVLVERDVTGLGQQAQRTQATATRCDAIVTGRLAALGFVGMNDEVLQQALGLDECRQFADILTAGLAHVERGRHEARQRDQHQVARREGFVFDARCRLGGSALGGLGRALRRQCALPFSLALGICSLVSPGGEEPRLGGGVGAVDGRCAHGCVLCGG